jgi:hypothetical protein
VLDPTREGRQLLTDAIRRELIKDGTLGAEAVVMPMLEPRSLTRAEGARATSYLPGDILVFRRDNREEKLRRGVGYRVDRVDAEAGTVHLRGPRGKPVIWNPARWGGDQAEAYTEGPQEFRTGDRLQFTRNNYAAQRLNGSMATVVAIDQAGSSVTVELDDGTTQALDLRRLADRHLRSGWVRTIHSAQGATSDRVMAHMESFRANAVDARSVYVAISRAREGAALYTDNRTRLTEALGLRDGNRVGAIDQTWGREQAVVGTIGLDAIA